jgi:hypothetical protein
MEHEGEGHRMTQGYSLADFLDGGNFKIKKVGEVGGIFNFQC